MVGADSRFARIHAPVIAGVLPLALYIATMSRGLVWGDGIELAAVAATLGIAHPTGYPLFTLIGHAFTWIPVGTVYWRVTLWCAVCVAGASVMLYFLLRSIGDGAWRRVFPSAMSRALLALAGALTFAFSRGPWTHATRTEVYAMELAIQLGMLWLGWEVLRRRSVKPFWGMTFLFGLGMTHHMLTVTLAPLLVACGWVLLRKRAAAEEKSRLAPRPGDESKSVANAREIVNSADAGASGGASWVRVLVPAAALFVLGLTPVLYLPVRAAQSPTINWGNPSSFDQFVWTVTGGEFRQFRFLMREPGEAFSLKTYWGFFFDRGEQLASYLSGQVFSPSEADNPLWIPLIMAFLVFLGLGFRRVWQQSETFVVAMAGCSAVYLFFLLTYNIADIRDYELGFLGLLWVPVWLGFAELPKWGAWEWQRVGEKRRARRLTAVVLALPLAAMMFNFRSVDRSGIQVADLYAVRLLNVLPPDAILLTAGDSDVYSAWYLQTVEDYRTDVLVYGSNFIFNEWYADFFKGQDLGGRKAGVAGGRPTTDVAFVETLGRYVIEPNLGKYPVYTTLDIPAMRVRYDLEPAAVLLTEQEYLESVERGEFPPPPVLFRIMPPGEEKPAKARLQE
jgi:hypothetical protein